jgi:hypothetical protein
VIYKLELYALYARIHKAIPTLQFEVVRCECLKCHDEAGINAVDVAALRREATVALEGGFLKVQPVQTLKAQPVQTLDSSGIRGRGGTGAGNVGEGEREEERGRER